MGLCTAVGAMRRERPDRSGAICVLGVSRAGTSLTARILDLAGVYLGPEEELLGGELSHIPERDRTRARQANRDGFGEHYRLMRLNQSILRAFGGSGASRRGSAPAGSSRHDWTSSASRRSGSSPNRSASGRTGPGRIRATASPCPSGESDCPACAA